MFRRISIFLLLIIVALAGAGCRKNKAVNPIANLDSKQPDKVLFDRAMDALQHNKFDVARLTFQTLINTYPDSEYIARAMLAVADSWYEEGGATGLSQAEAEYKNFETFFPNMAEAAEAQMKVANIHYRQMEKPDRDFTHAKRAEEEYREMIQQYPDSPLLPEAKLRLLEVQEVLAEREYTIGRFYFLRESMAAAVARLQSLVDTYPLYSKADEALFLLGQSYEGQLERIRAGQFDENSKARVSELFANKAAEAYSRIITRYPEMERADSARERLKALGRPVPVPTQEAIVQNKTEEASRKETGTFSKVMGTFHRRPDVAQAVKVGEPTLTDPKPTNATEVVKSVIDSAAKLGNNTATVETVKSGSALSGNQPAPRSSDGVATGNDGAVPLPPPTQVNDANSDPGATTTASSDDGNSKNHESSSRKKKKKGLRKLNPF